MTLPDFKEWASQLSVLSVDVVAKELETIFNQGRQLGAREAGDELWWIEQDTAMEAQTSEVDVSEMIQHDTLSKALKHK